MLLKPKVLVCLLVYKRYTEHFVQKKHSDIMMAFRIEHKEDGLGPFVTYDKKKCERRQHSVFFCTSAEAAEIRHRHEKFPTPSEEGLDIRREGDAWYCAYYSLKQIREMYNKDMILWLYRNGYKIKGVIINEKEAQYGKKQLLFRVRTSEVSVSC